VITALVLLPFLEGIVLGNPNRMTVRGGAEKTVASQTASQTTNDKDENKDHEGPVLAKRVGRVTVILPKS